MTQRVEEDRVLDLYVEVAPGGACMGHVPILPGLNFRAPSTDEVVARGLEALPVYVAWLEERRLIDLTAVSIAIVDRVSSRGVSGVRLRERERVPGAPVWESGNAAALFGRDRRALSEEEAGAHLRFLRETLAWIRTRIAPVSTAQRARQPAPGRRSIDETLLHIGNCIWWYASRIDDRLPEPSEVEGEDPLDRIDRVFALASSFISSLPRTEREGVHAPTRYPTNDPGELWTHAKVCRREAEHVWAHRAGILRDLRALAAGTGSTRPFRETGTGGLACAS